VYLFFLFHFYFSFLLPTCYLFFPSIFPVAILYDFHLFRTGPAGRLRLRFFSFLFILGVVLFADKLTSPLPFQVFSHFFCFIYFPLRNLCLCLFGSQNKGEAGITPILPLYFLSRPITVSAF
jgi:hypothetical protein